MNSFEDISKCEAEMQEEANPVHEYLNVVKNWPQSKKRELLFYFFGCFLSQDVLAFI